MYSRNSDHAALGSRLEQLALLAEEVGLPQIAQRARDVHGRANYSKVHLVVIGEFNRGKTTFVNALIGKPLLPMDIVPTTAAIWVIEKGSQFRAAGVMADGSKTALDISDLARLNADGDLCRPDLKFVQLEVPSLAIGDDVIVIDTPGVNDINEQRCEITYGFLAQADAAIFLIDASSPVTKSEAHFLQGQVLDSSLDKILFVLNKIDRIDSDEVDGAIEAAQERLDEILGKHATIVPIAAQRVLAALSEGSASAADEFGWRHLQEPLEELLRRARDGDERWSLAARRLHSLEQMLKGRLEARLALARLRQEELAALRAKFDADQIELRLRLERFKDYCLVQGRDRLWNTVSESLRQDAAEFGQALDIRVQTMKGDFAAFVERSLPFELQMFVKRWFESKRLEIERFLGEFSCVVSAEYTRHFGVSFGLPVNRLGSFGVHGQVASQAALVDPDEKVQLILPAAGYLAATFLIGGPFAIVGLVAGTFTGKLMQNRKVALARQQVLAELPVLISLAIEGPLKGLSSAVDQWFVSLTSALERQFESDFSERSRDLESTHESPAAASAIAAALQRLDSPHPKALNHLPHNPRE